METAIMGYIGTAIKIHSLIPSQTKVSWALNTCMGTRLDPKYIPDISPHEP